MPALLSYVFFSWNPLQHDKIRMILDTIILSQKKRLLFYKNKRRFFNIVSHSESSS